MERPGLARPCSCVWRGMLMAGLAHYPSWPAACLQAKKVQYNIYKYSTLSNILQRNKDNVYFAKHFYVAGCALLHWIFKLLRGESPQAVTGASHINMNTPGLTWISTWTMNFKQEFRYGLRNREMWNKSQKYASIYMETVPDAIQPAIGHELQIIYFHWNVVFLLY